MIENMEALPLIPVRNVGQNGLLRIKMKHRLTMIEAQAPGGRTRGKPPTTDFYCRAVLWEATDLSPML
jgi:hypothetical protein